NGLALFCGNVSKKEGQDDLQLWDIEPPMPLKIRLYRCDKEFVLDTLKEQLAVSEVFGLLVMDRKEATIGLLEGKRIEVLQKMTSGIPGKVRAGGQSSQRFHRITEGLTKEFYKRIADEMRKIFFDNKKLQEAVIASELENFVKSQPDGLEAVIGERGARLSGGQRQRIGLARALYHNPELLVLDETTSSLESEIEKRIVKT
ncbi:MAG: ATP-binding cassette domain-containing protein, partial [SAR324 cluster bacterium]|nr:ATP-binding cassette domain-containing protein [SAR324 cluster bacterium]